MSITVITKQYKELVLREREILRYAGCKTEEAEVVQLMRNCLQEAERALALRGQLCYAELSVRLDVVANRQGSYREPVSVENREGENQNVFLAEKRAFCDFGSFAVQSEQLAKNLDSCASVLLLAATAGVGIDRLIGKYGRIAPSKALMFQAIGTELVEAVCDMFSKEYEAEHNCTLRPRFSPGYGDLPLETQKDIFAVLEPARKIGLTLNDSLLMSPSKSVTAFAGITECSIRNELYGLSEYETNETQSKCEDCEKKDCIYRGE